MNAARAGAKIAAACLGLALWTATPATATPKNLQGKTVSFTFTTAERGGTCEHRSTIRFSKDQIFYSQEHIRCGRTGGTDLPKGYGTVIPVNRSGATRNVCTVEFGDRAERCTDGFIRKRDGSLRGRETWSGTRSSKVTEGQIVVSQRTNMVGSWSRKDGQSGSYDMTYDITLTIAVAGTNCRVSGYRFRASGSIPYAGDFRSSRKCTISG